MVAMCTASPCISNDLGWGLKLSLSSGMRARHLRVVTISWSNSGSRASLIFIVSSTGRFAFYSPHNNSSHWGRDQGEKCKSALAALPVGYRTIRPEIRLRARRHRLGNLGHELGRLEIQFHAQPGPVVGIQLAVPVIQPHRKVRNGTACVG